MRECFRHCFLVVGLTLIIVLLLSVSVPAQWGELEETEIHGHTMYTVFKAGDIPAIFEPTFISVAEADDYYYPNEPLVIVADSNEAHAYSTWHLVDHLVVNDRLGGRMITVTW